MMYVIGGRGRLGRAVLKSSGAARSFALPREVYAEWWRPHAPLEIQHYFSDAPAGSSVLVAAGLLDPALPGAEHERVNFDLPARVIEGACAAGLRVLTIGTAMEGLVAQPNPYIASKAKLGHMVAEVAAMGHAVTHLQVHTLYGGGEPAPFMFLGQMCEALRGEQPFKMSSGRQLREYHHVDDDAHAIGAVSEAKVDGVLALSHGDPCMLRDLAMRVFETVGRTDLLKIGGRADPTEDNYGAVLARPSVLAGLNFRPALLGVPTYVQSLVAGGMGRE
jgi:nucleoside-diphosphate-sugar epimerase